MSVFDELYFQNTRKVYFDFVEKSKDLSSAKYFIRQIPKNHLSKYKEIVFSEHEIENSDLNTNLWWVVIYSMLQALFIVILYAFHVSEKGANIVAPILANCIFIFGTNVQYKKKRKNIDLQRLLYFLEHYE